MTRLLLWRHGQTEWNADGRVQGQFDVELSAAGVAQAGAMAVRLAEERPDLIVSSDLHRAADTAAALAAITGLDVGHDQRLRERHFGPWQGMLNSEIAERWPDEYALWKAGEPVPGLDIESAEDVAKRVSVALQDVADRVPGGTAVVATHGAAARHGCGALLGWPRAVLRTFAVLANCHWTELRYDAVRGWQLWAHNAR